VGGGGGEKRALTQRERGQIYSPTDAAQRDTLKKEPGTQRDIFALGQKNGGVKREKFCPHEVRRLFLRGVSKRQSTIEKR